MRYSTILCWFKLTSISVNPRRWKQNITQTLLEAILLKNTRPIADLSKFHFIQDINCKLSSFTDIKLIILSVINNQYSHIYEKEFQIFFNLHTPLTLLMHNMLWYPVSHIQNSNKYLILSINFFKEKRHKKMEKFIIQ